MARIFDDQARFVKQISWTFLYTLDLSRLIEYVDAALCNGGLTILAE